MSTCGSSVHGADRTLCCNSCRQLRHELRQLRDTRVSRSASGYEPCWIDSPECTACDECTTAAPGVFAYNAKRQAIVTNPKGARYADIVKCAEKCTAACLHPGSPWNPAEPNLDKLRARAAKYN